MKRFNPEKELNKVQYGDRKKLIGIIVFLLVIIAVGSTYALYQVRHTQKLVFNTVGEFKKRDIYLSVLVDGEYQNDFPSKEEGMLYGGYECDGSAKINFDTEEWQVALYASHPDKCTVKFGHKYVDQSGANYPELYQGMIPVYFENGKIYVADITSEWYNYDDNKWANAVLIDYQNKKDKFYDDNGNLLGGHEVSEEDILQMYVWIPRYKYQLFNVNNEEVPKQLINIAFETGTANTGNIKCTYTNNGNGTITEDCKDKTTQEIVKNDDWYTHPAFTFKGTTEESGTELPGIWVGKFEPSDPTDPNGRKINEINEITILPNKTSMVLKSISVGFNATREIGNLGNKYNLNSNIVDTHMMKVIDWGAVAYLTQSIYGIYKDKKTCNIEMNFETCEVWINNVSQGAGTSGVTNEHGGSATGCVGDSVSEGAKWNQDNGSIAVCPEGRKWNQSGIKASTTGNMYGIYDMAGGAWEYLFGININNNGNIIYSHSGFSINNFPKSKYLDLYGYTDKHTDYKIGHLGDATREIVEKIDSTNHSWNNDILSMPISTDNSYYVRGGNYNTSIESGFFAIGWSAGGESSQHSFRTVITSQDALN